MTIVALFDVGVIGLGAVHADSTISDDWHIARRAESNKLEGQPANPTYVTLKFSNFAFVAISFNSEPESRFK
jgi:hypothetical protein